MIKAKLTLEQMIEAQQRSDIQRATSSLAAFKVYRTQSEKHYKDRELEERFLIIHFPKRIFTLSSVGERRR